MTTIRFTGAAAAVAQVDTFTPGGTIEADDIFILTVTGTDNSTHVISAAAGGTAASDVVTALKTAWNASTNALCTGITASGTNTLILTADTAGVGFSVAGTTTEANGDPADDQTFSRAATTANSGPKDWSAAANWSSGAVPGGASGQDVYVEDAEILYGLDQSGISNALNSLNILRSSIGDNPASGCLAQYLQIQATTVNVGLHTGPGTSTETAPVNIDTGSTASTINIYASATNSSEPAVRIKANSASTVVNIKSGTVGIAYESGETTTIGTLNVTYTTSQSSDANVYAGSGLTVTTININGGINVIRCGATTINLAAGTLTTYGSGAITTINQSGGTLTSNSTGTITTLNCLGGTADLTKSSTARTITTLKVGSEGIFKYNPAVMTLTNGVAANAAAETIECRGAAA